MSLGVVSDRTCAMCNAHYKWSGVDGIKCTCRMDDKHLVNTFLYLRRKHGKMRLDGFEVDEHDLRFMAQLRNEMMQQHRDLYRDGWVRVE